MEIKIKPLVGQKIRAVRRMTNEELERQGWDTDSVNLPAIVIETEDGIKVFALCDPEGNGNGCLFAETAKGEGFYVEEES